MRNGTRGLDLKQAAWADMTVPETLADADAAEIELATRMRLAVGAAAPAPVATSRRGGLTPSQLSVLGDGRAARSAPAR